MTRPIVWSIAGSDSGGGAGIQADVKTIFDLGAHPCTVLTAITAQNTRGVSHIEWTSPKSVQAQLHALSADLTPRAIKIGMTGNQGSTREIVEALRKVSAFKVFDPVMFSTQGDTLTATDGSGSIRTLLDEVDLVTPNIAEAQALSGQTIRSYLDMQAAAGILLDQGCRAVLVKGGDLDSSLAQDYYLDDRKACWLTSPRIDVISSHGTGCTLSSAIASCVSLGMDAMSAIVVAKAFVTQSLANSLALGKGVVPLRQSGWPSSHAYFPKISDHFDDTTRLPTFSAWPDEPIGFYPIVDSYESVVHLTKLGVQTLQLRMKGECSPQVEQQIVNAIAHAKQIGARLVINDHWQVALKEDAFGIHLGQDDLDDVPFETLAKTGIRLGISTHSYAEMSRALTYRPSYIALGTLFETKSKTMTHPPLMLDRFAAMAKLSSVPVVAIGGISIENAKEVRDAGAHGLALISDIRRGDSFHPERVRQWLLI